MSNESKQQNVSQETLAKQKFLASMSAVSETYKKAENSDILPSISKYTAKARGERMGVY